MASTNATLYFRSVEHMGTQEVIVKLGDHEIGRYLPGTSRSDYAVDEVVQAFAQALGQLVQGAMQERGIEIA